MAQLNSEAQAQKVANHSKKMLSRISLRAKIPRQMNTLDWSFSLFCLAENC